MSYKNDSTKQLVERWEDQRDIKNLMGKFAVSFLIKREKEIFGDFWSGRADVCYGVNAGWYSGAEAVKGYFDGIHQSTLKKAALFKQHFGEKLADKNLDDVYGMGILTVKPMSAPVIEVAGDGRTAKGVWYCQGSYSDVTPAGPVAFWTFGTYCVDFIREGNAWRIWHLFYAEDVNHPCGQDWSKAPEFMPEAADFAELKAPQLPEPNVPGALWALYSQDRPFKKLPRLPESYDSFEKTFSYGIQEVG